MTNEEIANIVKETWIANWEECKALEIKSPEVIFAGFIADIREKIPAWQKIDPVVLANKFLKATDEIGGIK